MARIELSREMPLTHQRVWEAISDLASHQEWMRDAESLTFVGDQTRGVGTTMEVETRVGPFHTLDILEVTGWEEGSFIDVAHRGLISGWGRLQAESGDESTIVTWTEELRFPWWVGGNLTAWAARPVLRSIWRGNLERLENSLSDL